ncbi:hypothetical protein HK097_000789 [Rhizophlyctis rosea]|uniref:Peptidase A1 domain-containing protein n=1 Tax=Rhizophlyctis rosea TaxID=64517 RepID=A0AAD5X7K3_9FUNG|nr:hypothetical protein HK097_000789 [Rhizophlyctis rosea]
MRSSILVVPALLSAFAGIAAAEPAVAPNEVLGVPAFSIPTKNKNLAAVPVDKRLAKRLYSSTDVEDPTRSFVYHGQIKVGNPTQNFSVLFDTGSYQLWLRSTDCTSSFCTGQPQYDPSKSSSAVRTGEKAPDITYVDGTSVSGNYVTDKVSIGLLSIDNLTINAVSSMNGESVEDGIMGMCNPAPKEPANFFQSLQKKGIMTSDVMGYYIDQTNVDGEVDFGGINAARFKGNLTWLPSLGYGAGDKAPYIFFQSKQTGMGFKGTQAFFNLNMVSVFDTGASLMVLPPDLALNLSKALTMTKVTTSPSDYDMYEALCPNGIINTWPNMTLAFGDVELQLTPKEYLYLVQRNSDGAIVCRSGWIGMRADQSSGTNPSAPGAILGNTFLRRFYSVFDWNQQRVGFAVAERGLDIIPNYVAVPGNRTSGTGEGNGAADGTGGKWLSLVVAIGVGLWFL